MTTNQKLYDQAVKSINTLFSDDSVSSQVTHEKLEELKELIDSLLFTFYS